ncbi:MAG: ABC transporter ATP-binding protein [Bdellovibrionota bacterium]
MTKRKPLEQTDDLSGEGFERRVVLRLVPYLRPHAASVALSSLLVFTYAGIMLYTPRLLGRIVDQALIPHNYDLLRRLVLLYVGLELIRVCALFTQSYRLQKVGQNVMQAIRRDLFARLLRMPVPFFDKNPVGKLVTRVTNDTVNLAELFSASFVMLLSDLLLIGGVIIAMLLMHWKLGLAAIAVFPLMIFAMTYFSSHLRACFRASRDVLARLNGFYAERMQGMPVVQLMEREPLERAHYAEISAEYRDRQYDGIHLYSLFHPTITVLSAASIALVLWFGPGFLEAKEIPLGIFVSFLAYVQVLYQPVRSITDRYNIYLAAMSSAERIFTLMDMHEEEGVRGSGLKNSGRKLGALRFEDVSFVYPTSAPGSTPTAALSSVSFTVNEGETVAIVGHTGAGKSTITNLLFRFYEPTRGRILLGGRDLSSVPKPELRERIGFVQQDVFLFSGTLRENLSLMREGISEKEILAGCALTGFDRVLAKLPRGLDTELDERGANLSLGERQILAFTRVFLQKPDLLVLDEATSSVDRESEILLQNASREITKGCSALVIAHRLETVRHADRILVFERGRLIEEGNHSKLLNQGGKYAQFVKLQLSRQAAQPTL